MPAGANQSSQGRLTRRAEFLRVRPGPAWRTPGLVLQARKRDDAGGRARFGFTATKRIGSAVQRNRARRRLKETVRLFAGEHAKPGYDYVVIARREALTRDFEKLKRDLGTAFEKVHSKRT